MAITKFNFRQGLKSSILLGWRIETNWANIFIVFLVKCSKPFAVALMLSAMYSIASGPNAQIKDLSWVLLEYVYGVLYNLQQSYLHFP